ncbi:hypothetical protein ABZY45_13625 [Streptomyces sp. NPDC006516]|uniref:hypothetical protein n=1 Tax=Streptomyces sp. NPDC006516 TaxID=3154309 RepID=UPI0033B24E14
MSFLDSDVGFVEAGTPDGSSWEGLLNREMAKSYEIPLEHFPMEPAVAGALAWSAAAGLTPDEEASSALLVALGLPGATYPSEARAWGTTCATTPCLPSDRST